MRCLESAVGILTYSSETLDPATLRQSRTFRIDTPLDIIGLRKSDSCASSLSRLRREFSRRYDAVTTASVPAQAEQTGVTGFRSRGRRLRDYWRARRISTGIQ